MQTLLLCQKDCPALIPKDLGLELGSGADGQVFELNNCPDKVLKISVLFDLDKFSKIESYLNYLSTNYIDTCARVYEYKNLGHFNRDTVYGSQDYILYYYVMEKCFKISEDEKKVFHSILSHEDRGFDKNFSLDLINKMLQGLALGLDFDKKKVILFCEKIKQSSINHLDLHVRNIMKNDLGFFKMVDLDRIELR